MSLHIRPMTRGDLASCVAIVDGLEFFQEYGVSGDSVGAMLEEALETTEHTLLVATSEARVSGFAWLVNRGAFCRSAYLRLIGISDADRRRGVGRALMAALEDRFLPETDLTLLVTESNAPAREFYAGLGYQQVGALPDYVKPGVTECIYFKPRVR